ncbi:MAG: ferritin [Deferrisomatales bacterium]
MLSQTLQDALNEQMKNEFFSAYLYKAMSAYFESEDLPGFASFFHVQALEELTHADKFFRFVCESGGRARLLAFDEPKNDYTSPREAFEYALEHERKVTGMINRLMDLAIAENDHAARIFLQWFVTEQVEEEASFSAHLANLKRVEGDGRGLILLDQELGKRTFTPPAGGGE